MIRPALLLIIVSLVVHASTATASTPPASLASAIAQAQRENRVLLIEFGPARPAASLIERQIPTEVIFVHAPETSLRDARLHPRRGRLPRARPLFIGYGPELRPLLSWSGEVPPAAFQRKVEELIALAKPFFRAREFATAGREAEAHIWTALGLRREEDLRAALAELQAARRAAEGDLSLIQLVDIQSAAVAAAAGHQGRAIRELDQIVADPRSAENAATALLVLGDVYSSVSRDKPAIEAFSRAAAVAPRGSEPYRQAIGALRFYALDVFDFDGDDSSPLTVAVDAVPPISGRAKVKRE